ncbi:MAG: hypothetical protein IJS02_05680 [Bacteroidales bacterium]|nr:hypothetical protein [Bacteroidales bacterium]
MNKKILVISLLSLLTLCGCIDNRLYDLSKGLNTEITLFDDEVSVPIGSIGPITMENVLIEGLEEFVKQDSKGNFYIDGEERFFHQNIYQIDRLVEDKTSPFDYQVGTLYESALSLPSLLSSVGLGMTNQVITFKINNPLNSAVYLSGTPKVVGNDEVMAQVQLDSEELRALANNEIVRFTIPEEFTMAPDDIYFEDFELLLPENMTDKIWYESSADITGTFKYKGNVAAGPDLHISMELPTISVNIPVAQFNLHKAKIDVVVENSLPINVTVDHIAVVTDDELAKANNVVTVTCDLKLAAGTMERPSTTSGSLELAASSGTIPDIKGIIIEVTLTGDPDVGVVTLSSKQGVYVKSSSLKVQGGITIPQ